MEEKRIRGKKEEREVGQEGQRMRGRNENKMDV
jgi:hypothetical protein